MNDLAIIDGSELAEMADILGAETSSGSSSNTVVKLPVLTVQHSPIDDDSNPMPHGQFFLKGMDTPVYAKTITFRPLASHIQYFLWEGKGNDAKLIKSRALKNLREEARDTAGTIACGMPDFETLIADKDLNDKYKYCRQRVVRGLVSYEGKTLSGEKVTVENTPCIYFGKGRTNYGGFFNEYIKGVPKGSKIYEYAATLSTERLKNGSTVFFKVHWSPATSEKLSMDKDTFETLKVFADTIRAENKYVDDQYFKAIKEDSLDATAIDAIEESLDADFEDA